MTRKLQITTPSDREVAIVRTFDAPKQLLWDAHTKPELVKRWLGVFNGHTFTVCDMDLRVGGKYRWVWRLQNGAEMGMGGTYKEISAPDRLVTTEKVGRVRTCKLGPRRLEEETAWIERYRQLWDARFDALERVVEELKRKEKSHGSKK